MASQAATNEGEPLSTLIFTGSMVFCGLLLGWGIRSLYWSFGWPGKECLNCSLDDVGFSGLDNLGWLPASNWSIGCIVFGVLAMVILNAGAWRRTAGY